ncbi:MAG: cytochrome c peroxidase [Pseudomonadota bacterium]
MGVCATASDAIDLPRPVSHADYASVNPAEARLGQLLFYDPILSGNREVSCATCHHPAHGTSDGLSLGIGDGGIGLGPKRRADPANLPEQRIPRNAPALFNLGAHEFTVLFHDGRIEADPERPGGLRTPLDEDMVAGFASLLSAQTMFPVLSPDEMAGHYGENEISKAVRQGRLTGPDGAWDLISRRVARIADYAEAFTATYPEIDTPEQIGFTDISNAVAAFMAFEWRSDTSPFDAYLRDGGGLSLAQAEGMALFYGEAGCATCHAGPFQTDHGFHAMAAPQIGPGKAARFESHARDEGRMRVTGRAEDAYAFRTPSLRNVTLTGPYGHAGAHRDLGAFLRDHVAADGGLVGYDPSGTVLPELAVSDFRAFAEDGDFADILAARQVAEVPLSSGEIDQLLAFLTALEDPVAVSGRLGVPDTVPSGLPVVQP